MIGAKLDNTKGNFFDRRAVIDAVGRAAAKVFSKFGAYVRRRDRSSIRTRKRASRPGEPPTNRTRLLKDFIFFAFDAVKESVVIGPVDLHKPGDQLATLEYGGAIELDETQLSGGLWLPTGLARQKQKTSGSHATRRRRVRVAPRPHTEPAFAKELPGVPAMWRDAVR
jgi:hypothetical protein